MSSKVLRSYEKGVMGSRKKTKPKRRTKRTLTGGHPRAHPVHHCHDPASETPFHPDVDSGLPDQDPLEHAQHLYEDAFDRQGRLDNLALELMKEEQEQCPFSPAINDTAHGSADDATRRLLQWQEDNKRHIDELRQEEARKRQREERQQCTFAPKIHAAPRATPVADDHAWRIYGTPPHHSSPLSLPSTASTRGTRSKGMISANIRDSPSRHVSGKRAKQRPVAYRAGALCNSDSDLDEELMLQIEEEAREAQRTTKDASTSCDFASRLIARLRRRIAELEGECSGLRDGQQDLETLRDENASLRAELDSQMNLTSDLEQRAAGMELDVLDLKAQLEKSCGATSFDVVALTEDKAVQTSELATPAKAPPKLVRSMGAMGSMSNIGKLKIKSKEAQIRQGASDAALLIVKIDAATGDPVRMNAIGDQAEKLLAHLTTCIQNMERIATSPEKASQIHQLCQHLKKMGTDLTNARDSLRSDCSVSAAPAIRLLRATLMQMNDSANLSLSDSIDIMTPEQKELADRFPQLFKGHLNTGFFLAVFTKMTQLHLPPATHLVRAGEVGTSIMFITKGNAKVTAEDGQHLTTMEAGTFFGEVSALETGVRTANVIAISWMDVFELEGQDLRDTLDDHPEYKEQFMELLAQRRARSASFAKK